MTFSHATTLFSCLFLGHPLYHHAPFFIFGFEAYHKRHYQSGKDTRGPLAPVAWRRQQYNTSPDRRCPSPKQRPALGLRVRDSRYTAMGISSASKKGTSETSVSTSSKISYQQQPCSSRVLIEWQFALQPGKSGTSSDATTLLLQDARSYCQSLMAARCHTSPNQYWSITPALGARLPKWTKVESKLVDLVGSRPFLAARDFCGVSTRKEIHHPGECSVQVSHLAACPGEHCRYTDLRNQ